MFGYSVAVKKHLSVIVTRLEILVSFLTFVISYIGCQCVTVSPIAREKCYRACTSIFMTFDDVGVDIAKHHAIDDNCNDFYCRYSLLEAMNILLLRFSRHKNLQKNLIAKH